MNFQSIITKLSNRQDLVAEESQVLMRSIIEGDMSDAGSVRFLSLSTIKGFPWLSCVLLSKPSRNSR